MEVRNGGQVRNPPPPPHQEGQRHFGVSRWSRSCTREIEKSGRTWTDRLTEAAQDAVLEEAVTLLGDRTGLTVEAQVCNGLMVTTPPPPPPPPPHQDVQRTRGGSQNCQDEGTSAYK